MSSPVILDHDVESQVEPPCDSPEEMSNQSCLICYEEFDTKEADEGLIVVESCQHEFCRACLQQHCQHAIFAKHVPVACPCRNDPNQSCPDTLSTHLVESLLTTETDLASERAWRLYQRLEQLRSDSSLITCPWCDAIAQNHHHHKDSSSSRQDTLSCQACQKNFCAIHGSAHPNETCAQYQKRQKTRAEKKSEKAISRFTKACSHCGGRIQKDSGCDHVICPACNNDMCYRCGTHEYLTGKVVRTCGKCQQGFLDHRYQCIYRFQILLWMPLLIPCFFIYAILMIVLALLTGGFGCCFGLGRCLHSPQQNEVEMPSSERAVRLGLSLVALPWIALLRDFGVQRWRLPHEIYYGTAPGGHGAQPEIPTLHVLSDIESPTNSSSDSSW